MGSALVQVSTFTSATALPSEKQEFLFRHLKSLDSVLVALSGGADSAYLAWAAHQALGPRALAITALSASFSAHDRAQVAEFVRRVGLKHEYIETQEFDNPLYVANNADRCYWCKDALFSHMDRIAKARDFVATAYGINADDTRDFRPGHRAAAEHRVLAPLLDAGLAKNEIRELSRTAQLPTWDRPASACLSSRIPYGTPVTAETLSLVEQGESILRTMGFLQFRVRFHGDLARIEIAPEELPRALQPEMMAVMNECFRKIGFAYVTLDLQGYRQGSLNEALKKK